MASTPTPPQCSAISVAKPSQNHHRHRHHQSHHLKNQRQTRPHWVSNRFSLSNPPPAAASSATAAASVASDGGAPCLSFPSSRSLLGADFSGRRSTRFVSKVHAGRPGSSNIPHSSVADEALKQLLQCGKDDTAVLDSVLLNFEHRLSGSSDYAFLIRELGNCKECGKATRCYDFALRRENRKYELGRLTSAMISVLGRLGKVDDARSVFETAKKEGYGDTVYTHSALISAYGRNSFYNEAISVFESMKNAGIKPNLVTYNAVIDAGAKGGVRFDKVVEIFDEMLANGVQPDSITYNSLLAVCSHVGSWEMALDLFREMGKRGLAQDVCTYNTLLDAVCKGGQIDLASEIMAEMSAKKLSPTVVTYSTVIDGYAKAGRLQEALSLFNEMKSLSIELDRISYNTKVSIYASLGRFVEAMETCREMESCGFEKEVVTCNALLDGYGKHGRYDEVKKTFEQMKAENVKPNVLTYSTMIDVYSKGGLYREAMDVYREFKRTGLKADVVLYSALIDAVCKNGLVESAVMLLDEMTAEGVRPNVVTYNSIIDAFGRSPTLECGVATSTRADEHQIGPSSSMLIAGPSQNQVKDNEDKQIIIKMFGQLAAEKAGHLKKDTRGRRDTFNIMGLFRKMHELGIKPNVVTFSAMLNACSRCNSFEEARMLLEELRLFDNMVYGVAYGLLMGYRENIWFQAQSLFDEVKRLDSSTASAFYNALTDMLWHFGQKQGAQLVVLEGKRRNVWDGVLSDSCLDLHLMSCGAACAMVHSWLLDIRSIVFEGHELPKLLSILTGWGKHSKVVGDGTLRKAIEALLNGMGAPFRVAECNLGRFISPGYVLAAWLKELSAFKLLVLHDHINYPVTAKSGQVYNWQPLRL